MEKSSLDRQRLSSIYTDEQFSRTDDSDDTAFYARDRFVDHLDPVALSTVERLIGTLIVEKRPAILDLMAGWRSHIPEELETSEVVGLGLNKRELSGNEALTSYVIHDLNGNPKLPFSDHSFDVVLNTVSVDYMTKPFQVFDEVARVLKPGGLFLVIFSNRMFPQKAVKIWRESSELERIIFVEDLFNATEGFEKSRFFCSKGKPRPKDDKYAYTGLPSDPIYAVYAEKKGDYGDRKTRPAPELDAGTEIDLAEVDRNKIEVKRTLKCPYCGVRMKKWAVPQTPYTEWENEFMYVCFNDDCGYFRRGWDEMNRQGNIGFSYRLMYHPEKDAFLPLPVPSFKALKESIVEDVS